jgi:hypothetical protein
MICKHCTGEFKPRRPGKPQKFCSHACHNKSMRRVDHVRLTELVELGMGKSRMARELGVQRITVRGLITNLGLEALWRQRRYHKDGSGLANGAYAANAQDSQSASTV